MEHRWLRRFKICSTVQVNCELFGNTKAKTDLVGSIWIKFLVRYSNVDFRGFFMDTCWNISLCQGRQLGTRIEEMQVGSYKLMLVGIQQFVKLAYIYI